MAELKGSKTLENMMTAFAGESQARNKYTYFASAARKEGYNQIADFFEETAGNEKEHAKIWFKLIRPSKSGVTISMTRLRINPEKESRAAAPTAQTKPVAW